MTVLCTVLRLVGRLFLTAADELDRADFTYRAVVPDEVPEHIDDGSAQ